MMARDLKPGMRVVLDDGVRRVLAVRAESCNGAPCITLRTCRAAWLVRGTTRTRVDDIHPHEDRVHPTQEIEVIE